MISVNIRISRRSAPSLLAIFVTLAAAATLVGCSGDSPPDSDGKAATDHGESAQALAKPGASLTAFRLSRAVRSRSDAAQAGAALAALLYGQTTRPADFQLALANASAGREAFDVAVESQPGLQFSYRADNDQRLVINETVTSNMGTPADIGKDAARAVFLSTFRAALASGAVPSLGLNPNKARSSRIVQGEGASGEAPIERTSEYIFTVPREINGVEIFDAGFEVSVHRAGQLARVQSFGPAVASSVTALGNELPDAAGYSFARTVSQADLESRVAAEHPSADVRAIGVRYWLPPGVASAVVEPTQLYFVVPTSVVEGQKIMARGFYASYSLRNPGQPPTVWPQAEHNPPGDGRK